MSIVKNPNLTPYAQRLRKDMTKEEKHLWYDFLKKLPCTVNRQKVFGPYIADFYIASADLILEVDGGQHLDERAYQQDRIRDQWFQEQGLTVLRFSNEQVRRNFSDVCCSILQRLPRDVRENKAVIALIPEKD